jgi:rod shape-determining protein MreC
VARVEELTSEVILVSDPAHAIPVQINRNGLRTIAVGTGDISRLNLPYLPTSADVVVGDLLVTSGLGGGFPAGYPVGTVTTVKRDPAQSLAEIDVRPAAALDRSRELMLVWLKPSAVLPATTPTSAQPATQATAQPAATHAPAAAPAAKPIKAPAAKAPAVKTPAAQPPTANPPGGRTP